MYFEQVYERGLAQSSYLVGCQASGEAIVIDPRRDIDVYLEIAEREGLTIRYVTETHIHADFLSGARELAQKTGARLLLSDEGGEVWRYDFPHVPLKDNDEVEVGNVLLKVLHTPGHTPEHISFLLYDRATGAAPRMIFTGDFLFVGDVGRPDLLDEAAGMSGTREPGAHDMWRSVQRLTDLPDHLQIWPGHGAGSACGKSLGAVPTSTLGYERTSAWAFTTADEQSFVSELLDGQPEAPFYFAQMKALNKDRPSSSVLTELPIVSEQEPSEIAAPVSTGEIQLVDLRPGEEWASAHMPGSINIPYGSAIVNWFGWLLDYDRPIAIVGERWQIGPAQRALARIGLDRLQGFVESGRVAGTDGVARTKMVDVAEARTLRMGGAQIVDVRSAAEYADGHIEGAIQIHAGTIARRVDELSRDRDLLLHCQTGYRSSIATSVLDAAGFTRIANIRGGIVAWREQIGEGIVVPDLG